VQRDVAGRGRKVELRQVEARAHEGRPGERAMGARDHAKLPGQRVGAGHGDARRQAAALVGVAAVRAVLVPRHVGDALDHAQRLHQRLDVELPRPAELVPDAGDRTEALEARLAQQRRGALGPLREALHAHQAIRAVGRARPPGGAVSAAIRRRGAVHVGGDRGHLRLAEDASDV